MNTKIRSLKKVSSCGPQRTFGYNIRRIWPVYQNEFDMPGLEYKNCFPGCPLSSLKL